MNPQKPREKALTDCENLEDLDKTCSNLQKIPGICAQRLQVTWTKTSRNRQEILKIAFRNFKFCLEISWTWTTTVRSLMLFQALRSRIAKTPRCGQTTFRNRQKVTGVALLDCKMPLTFHDLHVRSAQICGKVQQLYLQKCDMLYPGQRPQEMWGRMQHVLPTATTEKYSQGYPSLPRRKIGEFIL